MSIPRNIGATKILDNYMKRQVEVLNARIAGLEKEYRSQMRQMLTYAAKPIVYAAARKAAKSKRTHYYFKDGKKQAKFTPGHLAKSVQVLKGLRKDQAAVYIGPYISGKISGTYGGARSNAYYAHFVEFGTRKQRAQPFMRPALDIGGPQAIHRLELIAKLYLKQYERRYGNT
jgi:HK97 gp10 family phage protein